MIGSENVNIYIKYAAYFSYLYLICMCALYLVYHRNNGTYCVAYRAVGNTDWNVNIVSRPTDLDTHV